MNEHQCGGNLVKDTGNWYRCTECGQTYLVAAQMNSYCQLPPDSTVLRDLGYYQLPPDSAILENISLLRDLPSED